MFGFWSFLPLSTSGSVFYNTQDTDLILYIQQDSSKIHNIVSTISFIVQIQERPEIIL
jgi:hypothetical protein